MLFSAAASQGVINATVHANMTAIVVLSMALTPLFLIIQNKFTKTTAKNMDGVNSVGQEQLHGNVLIIGFGRVGQIASQAPIAFGAQISIIDNDPDVIRRAEPYGFKVYYGDGAREDILHATGAYNADCVLVCVDNADDAVRIVENLKHHCPTTKVLARAYDREHAFKLIKADADYVIRETFESSMLLGHEVLKHLGADDAQIQDICQKTRRADDERFALEVAGDDFTGRALLFNNTTS